MDTRYTRQSQTSVFIHGVRYDVMFREHRLDPEMKQWDPFTRFLWQDNFGQISLTDSMHELPETFDHLIIPSMRLTYSFGSKDMGSTVDGLHSAVYNCIFDHIEAKAIRVIHHA